MNKNFLIFSTCLLVYPLPVLAHSFTGRIGFYDGLSHPVLGLDHFLAMLSVGIVSAQSVEKLFGLCPQPLFQ